MLVTLYTYVDIREKKKKTPVVLCHRVSTVRTGSEKENKRRVPR